MAWMAGAGAVGGFILMGTDTAGVYLVAMPIALLGAWGWPGIFFFTVVHSFPEFPARASGLVLSSNLTGTVIGPLVVGSFAGHGNYPGAWIFVAVTSAIATLAFAAANRQRRHAAVGV